MAAAIYARYISENQRPESIDDQVSACRKLAKQRSLTIPDEHIYADQAQSGARSDRPSLAALMAAAHAGEFVVVLVDGIRVISVADGLDSDDEESTLAIQVRGIFNELQLRDLKKKTLRGQIGQNERGFFVGEETFRYRSVPVGEMRMDKKGRPRPDGYKMEIEPAQAATIVRIFTSYADGMSLTQIVKTLNEEIVPGSIRSSKGWSPATHQPDPRQREVRRPLDLEPNREPPGSSNWAAQALREARIRVGHPRGRGTADHPESAVGDSP
jgi:site-specific DNA recombinase